MKSYPLTAAFLASTCHTLSHSGPWSIPHLHFQHQDCTTHRGEGREAAGCCRGVQGGLFPGDALFWRAMVNLLSCLHASLGRMGDQVSPGLLPGMALHLCTSVLFFFSFPGHKLGDVNTQQELWPMIIIFPQ